MDHYIWRHEHRTHLHSHHIKCKSISRETRRSFLLSEHKCTITPASFISLCCHQVGNDTFTPRLLGHLPKKVGWRKIKLPSDIKVCISSSLKNRAFKKRAPLFLKSKYLFHFNDADNNGLDFNRVSRRDRDRLASHLSR